MNNNSFKITFTDEERDLIARQYCASCTKQEFEIFIKMAENAGLSPFQKQIWNVTRRDYTTQKDVSQPLVSIDGFRLIAERTGRYAPGKETKYVYDDKGRLVCATAYVMKMTMDGTWHEVACPAFFSEYAAMKKDGTPTKFWAEKAHIMLSKCSEALSLRRAFPQELSGYYTDDEMDIAIQAKKQELEEEEKAKKAAKKAEKSGGEPKKETKEEPKPEEDKKEFRGNEEAQEVVYSKEDKAEIEEYFRNLDPNRRGEWMAYVDRICKVKELDLLKTIQLLKRNKDAVLIDFESWSLKQRTVTSGNNQPTGKT
jgi:phage recombination protein Bet